MVKGNESRNYWSYCFCCSWIFRFKKSCNLSLSLSAFLLLFLLFLYLYYFFIFIIYSFYHRISIASDTRTSIGLVKTFSALTGDQTCFSTVHVSPFHRRHLLFWICLWSMPDLWTRSGFDSWKSSRMRSDSHCGQDLRKSLECRWTKLRRHLYQLAVYHWVFVHLSKDSILGVRS